jgi:hypothetical protein
MAGSYLKSRGALLESVSAEGVSANEHRWMQDQRCRLHKPFYELVPLGSNRIRRPKIQRCPQVLLPSDLRTAAPLCPDAGRSAKRRRESRTGRGREAACWERRATREAIYSLVTAKLLRNPTGLEQQHEASATVVVRSVGSLSLQDIRDGLKMP